jgi:large subunit ribosomal protein L15
MIKPAHGSTKKRKRVARGNSGGGGTTAGRGTKGQDARSGKGKRKPGFEGGQVPLLMRQPKLGGFRRDRKVVYEPLNIGELEEVLDSGVYTLNDLREKRIIRTKKPVKLLGHGTLSKKFELTVHAASKSAKEALEKAGGTLTITK